jgi:hypothetical protein
MKNCEKGIFGFASGLSQILKNVRLSRSGWIIFQGSLRKNIEGRVIKTGNYKNKHNNTLDY